MDWKMILGIGYWWFIDLMILAGLGWGRLPHWQIERDLHEGRLVKVPTKTLGRDSEVPMEAYLGHRIDEPFGFAT